MITLKIKVTDLESGVTSILKKELKNPKSDLINESKIAFDSMVVDHTESSLNLEDSSRGEILLKVIFKDQFGNVNIHRKVLEEPRKGLTCLHMLNSMISSIENYKNGHSFEPSFHGMENKED